MSTLLNDLYKNQSDLNKNISKYIVYTAILISSLEFLLNKNSDLYQALFWNNISLYFCFFIFIYDFYDIHLSKENNNQKKYFRFTFDGAIDVLCILSVAVSLFSIQSENYLINNLINCICITRIWKTARYFEEFKSIQAGFVKKQKEIINPLVGILLVSMTLSTFIYCAEKESFDSVWDAFVWSIAKYTEDYPGITDAHVILTKTGKVLCLINGFLGIALFAVPAGLFASSFIDEISKQKESKNNNVNRKKLIDYLNKKVPDKYLIISNKRFLSFDMVKSKLLLTEDEIIKLLRPPIGGKMGTKKIKDSSFTNEYQNQLIWRSAKSNTENIFQDELIIELYKTNTSYGYFNIKPENKVTLISPSGYIQRFIDHFAFNIYENSPGINYVARNIRIPTKDESQVGANFSKFYNDNIEKPESISEFLSDIKSPNSNSKLLIILSSCAKEDSDIVYEFGRGMDNPNNDPSIGKKITTIESIISKPNPNSHLLIKTKNKWRNNQHSLLNNLDAKGVFDVIFIGVNIKILAGRDDAYFKALIQVRDIISNLNDYFNKS
ncbi:MAG: hypothetical protein EXR20_08405 [Bacteroidetes bacterium]|nr:hypothetical protein [Bacteroidota bacterium]